jgi:hypothetical protein
MVTEVSPQQATLPPAPTASIVPYAKVQVPFATDQTYSTYEARVAQAKFFRPQHPSNMGTPPPPATMRNAQYDNRWHRLLEHVEVPTRENLQVERDLVVTLNHWWLNPQALQRVPGKMNLNGTRYGETFHALLDDATTFDPFGYNPDGSYNDYLENATQLPSAPRSWWFEFVAGRDGIGTNSRIDQQAGRYVPGAPGAQPFRSFSMVERNPNNYTPPNGAPGPNSADDTLLRTMTQLEPVQGVAGAVLDNRHLFEARTATDEFFQQPAVPAPPPPGLIPNANPNTVDYYTRNRILSKIAGNTTNRSNVFAVWMTVGFFEGYRPDPVNNPDAVQIGAEMADQTRRRGFFVVDRSVLEDAWNPTTGTYDFHKFIQYRKTIQ